MTDKDPKDEKKKDRKEDKETEAAEKKANVVELDLSQMAGIVNETIEKMISEGKLVRDEETGEIIDPEDDEKIAETIEKNKALKKYRLESREKKKEKKV